MKIEVLPLTFVVRVIRPEHFTVTVTQVIEVIALVEIARRPSENTSPAFLIVEVLAFVDIRVAWTAFPDTFPMA